MDERSDKEPLGFGTGLERHIDVAVREGIEAIVSNHSMFADMQNQLFSHIDPKSVNSYIAEVYEELKEKEGTFDLEKLKAKVSSYIASGKPFDEEGKESILRKCLDEMPKINLDINIFKTKFERDIKEGEKYLDRTILAFRDLYHLMKSEEPTEKMSELTQAAGHVYDSGFFNAAIKVLYANKALTNPRYLTIKNALAQRIRRTEQKKISQGEVSPMSTTQSIAAAILSIFGISILLVNNSITGNIIGMSPPKTSIYGVLISIILLLGGVYFFLRGKNTASNLNVE
jgi:hypothetical protein